MDITMTLENIYAEYTQSSAGFAIAVETHCGFNISRDEIKRIAEKASDASSFRSIWENDDWWTDGNNH
jgi:hypothetical protein